MAEEGQPNPILALGQLRGLLVAFAWTNQKCNHSCTFTVEELPGGVDMHDSLSQYFGESAEKMRMTEQTDWHGDVSDALQRWLFQFQDLVKADAVGALTDQRCQREMVGTILDAFIGALQPLQVWKVEIEPRGFYECAWDDFAILGSCGHYLLHLGVSD